MGGTKINLFNGNNKRYSVPLPKIVILSGEINEVALNHLNKNTGILFKKDCNSYFGFPKSHYQIAKLFLTYNFKTEYHDNANSHNTLYLKFCDVAFKINSVCVNCLKYNGIHTSLKQKERLRC